MDGNDPSATNSTATLDTLGGLYTAANPQDLPEGASPRNYDVDYITGSVYQRPGLQNVYSYTATLLISAVTLYNSIGTFTYTGKTPSVNEGFALSGFVNQVSFLNGTTVYVLSVNATLGTFTAEVAQGGLSFGTFTGQNGIANSTIGNFVGPNAPSVATVVSSTGGNTWNNPTGILGNVTYASTTSGSTNNVTQTPTFAGNEANLNPEWSNPANILSLTASTSVTVTTASPLSGNLIVDGSSFAVPTDATISGVVISLSAGRLNNVAALNVQLVEATTLVPIGTAVQKPLGSTQSLTLGSSTYQWGTTLTPANINGAHFGFIVNAQLLSGSTSTITANSATVTVYYTLAGSSEILQTTQYAFAIPTTSGVSGFGVTFQAYSSAATTLSFQLLKNGIAVGDIQTQSLTTTPTVYTLGLATYLWGSTWSYADVNNAQFGVQVYASGGGQSFINDLDILTYVVPALVNFDYVKSFVQSDGGINTLALDASGLMWQENVITDPGVLSVALSGILPNTFARSATQFDQEYICFSNLQVGTDRPRVASINNVSGVLQFLPLSQVGPGASPAFQASVGSGGTGLTVTAYTVSAGVVEFTFNTSTTPVVGSLYLLEGTGNANIDGFTFSVLGTPSPTTTTFYAAAGNATGSASGLTATATPTYSYTIQSITQPPVPIYGSTSFNGQILLWSEGPTSTTPGSTITFYYGGVNVAEYSGIVDAFSAGETCIVYISGAPVANGTWIVTGHGIGIPPSEAGNVPYFTIQYTSSNYQRYGGPGGSGPNGPGNTGNFQITLATLTTNSPIPDLSPGDSVQITGATPSGWNGTWTIQDALTSGVYNILTSSMSATGVATYGYTVQSGVAPTNGQIVTTSGLTNSAIFNTTGVVSNVTGSTFQITGFSSGAISQSVEDGQAFSYGTSFTFDPGSLNVGTTTPSPIFGNDTGTGSIAVVGGSIQPIGAGTRQGTCFFITESGYETTVSAPVTFTTSENANYILVSNIPIGPPNVVARGIAFTEAGANGVPGSNFYVIPNPVTVTVGLTSTVYTSTIIQDNISTTAKFTFTDAVLLNSTEIDIQGNDLFNLIELGSSAWCVPYAGRMFYGLQLNKVQNFTNLSFDGGYLLGVNQPLGWTNQISGDQTLTLSPVTGQALYIKSTYGTVKDVGVIYQTAYQDFNLVPIINTNTTYSVRVAASIPSGDTVGTLVIDLVDYNAGIGFGVVYGSFSVPFSSMNSTVQVFSGTLLTAPFTSAVSSSLQLRLRAQNMGPGADLLIDRLEVYPTQAPYLLSQVYGSYIDDLEAIDASGSGGIIDTSSENSQACMGGFVMRDELYLLKTGSLYSTQDNPNSEPGGWTLREISNRVGAIGINSYDVGEEWCVTACRSGIYGFNGGQPIKIMQELWNLWECINWNYGYTIVLRNDIVNKRILCAVPLPTGTNPFTLVPTSTTLWLPNAPYNPSPTTPNVIFMLNYQGMSTFDELMGGEGVHATMFGTLAAPDLRRKWTIWQIPTPYMDFITQANGQNVPLYICNGINTSKIYQLENNQYSDDGVAINGDYCTYGFVNATKAATLPIFGFHAKRYTVLQLQAYGAGSMAVNMLPNVINPRYPYSVPTGITLSNPANDDYFRSINVKGNRMFVEVSTNAVGAWFSLNKVLLTGKADPWSNLNPTGGGNAGIM